MKINHSVWYALGLLVAALSAPPGIRLEPGASSPPRVQIAAPAAMAQTSPVKILRVAEDSLPGGLNPLTPANVVEIRAIKLVHDSPFQIGETGLPEASLIELDAQKQPLFEVMTDGRTAQGTLRKATFHDGAEITIDDLRSSLSAYEASAARYQSNDFFVGLVEKLTPRQPDPTRSFTLVLRRRLLYPGWSLSKEIMPRGAFKSPANPQTWADDPQYALKPVGAGPFKLDPTTPLGYNRARVSLLAHTTYHKGRPRLDGIELIGVPSTTEKLQQLRAGQIHMIVALSRSDQSTAKSIRNVDTLTYPMRNWWYLGYNCSQKPLDRKEVRTALSQLIDRRALGKRIGDVYEPDTAPVGSNLPASAERSRMKDASVILISGPFVADSPFYNRTVPQPQVDPLAARDTLIKTGLFELRENKLYAAGSPFTLELAYDKGLPDIDDIVVQLRQDFLDAGIKLNVTGLDSADWERKIDPRKSSGRTVYDLFLGRFVFDFNDDIAPLFSSNGWMNIFRYKSGPTDLLFDQAANEPDFERRANLMAQIHKQIAEDSPALFLWQAQQVAAISQSVKGVRLHSLNFYVNPYLWSLSEQ